MNLEKIKKRAIEDIVTGKALLTDMSAKCSTGYRETTYTFVKREFIEPERKGLQLEITDADMSLVQSGKYTFKDMVMRKMRKKMDDFCKDALVDVMSKLETLNK